MGKDEFFYVFQQTAVMSLFVFSLVTGLTQVYTINNNLVILLNISDIMKGYDGIESSRTMAAVNALTAATTLPALKKPLKVKCKLYCCQNKVEQKN